MHYKAWRARTRDRITAVLAATGAAALLSGFIVMGTATGVQATTDHCANHETTPKTGTSGTLVVDGVTVTVSISGSSVTFKDSAGNPISVDFCIKASTGAQDGSGTGGTYSDQNPGGQIPTISYVVVYKVKDQPEKCPEGTKRAGEVKGDKPCDPPEECPEGTDREYQVKGDDPCDEPEEKCPDGTDREGEVKGDEPCDEPKEKCPDGTDRAGEVKGDKDCNKPRVPIPDEPGVNDPCGPANATWIKPSDTDKVTWKIVDGHLIAETVGDLKFTDGTKSHDYGLAPDSGEACPVVVTVPVALTPVDPCGPENATWPDPLPAGDGFTWSVNELGQLVATVVSGEFEGGGTTRNFGVAPDSGEACPPVIPVPVALTPVDPCDPENATWPDPLPAGDGFTWSVNEAGELIATTVEGTTFEGGGTTVNFGVAPDSGTLCDIIGGVEEDDACPNIRGLQENVPAGFSMVNGRCVEDQVRGVQREAPELAPTVKGAEAEAEVPTAVDAGLSGPVTGGTSTAGLLGQGLVGGGLVLLMMAAWRQKGVLPHGAHQA